MSDTSFQKPTDELQSELDAISSSYLLKDFYVQLYHYTSFDSLLSIMESQYIWASNSFFLNDSKEIVHLKEFIQSTLSTVIEAPSLAVAEKPKLKSLVEDLYDMAIEQYKSKVYVLSLTDKSDSLPLWLNYGKNDGYNFKVQVAELFRLTSGRKKGTLEMIAAAGPGGNAEINLTVIPGKVIYDDIEKARITQEYVKLLIREIASAANKLPPSLPIAARIGRVVLALANFAYMAKHSSFAPESEYRILYAGQDEASVKYQRRFRSRHGVLVPYAEILFRNEEGESPIKEITIGPKKNMELANLGLRYYLPHKGLEFVSIRESMLPLRD